MTIDDIEIEDTFAEAFPMSACRVIITAATREWALTAATVATGYASSVIGCDAEAGIEGPLEPSQTPDGRPGVSILLFAFHRAALEKAVVGRVGQSIMTCPTTACFDGLPSAEKTINVGGQLRFFGDGWQISKLLGGRRLWRIPVMDGEFVCDESMGAASAVGGGNLILLAQSSEAALQAASAAVAAIRQLPDVILPFPGGIVRAGSKVGSKYKKLKASTNDAYCPTLRGVVKSSLPQAAHAAYEIVIDGLSLEAVERAMAAGIRAARRPGVVKITAGNYGGSLGPFHLHLRKLLVASEPA